MSFYAFNNKCPLMEPIEQKARRAHNQVVKGAVSDIKVIAERLN